MPSRGGERQPAGAEKIDSCLAVCRKNECPLRTVPIPGHYNVADWPSHLQKIRPGTNVYKSNKAGKQFETVFDPFQKSWEIMSDAYRGLRMKLELLEREGPWIWEEYEADELDAEAKEEFVVNSLMMELEELELVEDLEEPSESEDDVELAAGRKRPRTE